MQFSLIAAAVAAGAALLLAISGPAYRIGMSLTAAFTMLRWGAYLGMVAVALAGAATYLAHRREDRSAAAVGLLAIVLAAVIVWVPYSWQQRAQTVPPIHDISTDLENPPEFEAIVPLRADAPNSLDRPPDLAAQQRGAYDYLEPVTLTVPMETAFNTALAVAQDSGWEIVAADQSTGLIEATDTTRWFGFEDDVVVRLTPWGTGTRVDVRSVSRVGRSDAGTNARRIRRFLDELSSR